MVDPAWGPFLFDTSAESWLARPQDRSARDWFRNYSARHRVQISVATVVERVRGYALLWQRAAPDRRAHIDAARLEYLDGLGQVWPLNAGVALIAAEIMALLPHPPSPSRRSHHLVENRQERLVRWRFDILIAATALFARLPLIHNNPEDFAAVRSAVELAPERFPGLGPLQLIRTAHLA